MLSGQRDKHEEQEQCQERPAVATAPADPGAWGAAVSQWELFLHILTSFATARPKPKCVSLAPGALLASLQLKGTKF